MTLDEIYANLDVQELRKYNDDARRRACQHPNAYPNFAPRGGGSCRDCGSEFEWTRERELQWQASREAYYASIRAKAKR